MTDQRNVRNVQGRDPANPQELGDVQPGLVPPQRGPQPIARRGPRGRPVDAVRDAPRLATAFDPRCNSLNALRLVLAAAVLVSHSWQFVYDEHDLVSQVAGGRDIGELSVDGFFLVSGFLIVRSHLNSHSTGRYLWHRFLRIMPGFWVCLVVTAVALAPLLWWLGRDGLGGYPWTGTDSSLSYVLANFGLRMNQFNVGDLRGGQAVNGSLHTLYFEFLCYLMVAALGALGVLRRRPVVVLAVAGLFLLVAAVDAVRPGDALTEAFTVRFTGIFFIGAVACLYADRIPVSRWLLPPALALVVAGVVAPSTYHVFSPVGLGYLLLYAGTARRFARIGVRTDLSYGIYIYAWPVQLVLVELGVADWGLVAHVVGSLAATAAVAALSWRLVEKPAMSHKARPAPRLPGRARPETNSDVTPPKGPRLRPLRRLP